MQSVCSYPQFLNRKRSIINAPPLEIVSFLFWPRWHVQGLADALCVPRRAAVDWLRGINKMPVDKRRELVRQGREHVNRISKSLDRLESDETCVYDPALRRGGRGSALTASHAKRAKGKALHPRKKVSDGVGLIEI
jgi:hypothetical protein